MLEMINREIPETTLEPATAGVLTAGKWSLAWRQCVRKTKNTANCCQREARVISETPAELGVCKVGRGEE